MQHMTGLGPGERCTLDTGGPGSQKKEGLGSQ